ncbi:MAG: hypothetical protein HY809_07130 [Nitrospirae bacterium]|nr:hypothetical protein [Nitrospirota bacterium]
MISDITTGNSHIDAKEFRHWFIGDIRRWCAEKGEPFKPEKYKLRNTDNIEFRLGDHKKGEQRAGGWAVCSSSKAVSILIRGDITFKFRDPRDHSNSFTHRLASEGDYVMWKEDVEHWWETGEDSIILTVRWKD